MASIVDSYSESNQNAGEGTYAARTALGQSFTGNGGTLDIAKFYLSKSNSPTGNAVAKIYTHSGTYGTSSVPTGAALATSDNFDVSTLTTSYQLITFNFSGANEITLTNGTKYVLVIEYSGDSINFINWGVDTSSPAHGGNISRYTSGVWAADSARDFCFYVYDTTPATTTSTSTTSTSSSTSTTLTTTSTSTTTLPLEFFGIKISKPGVNVLKTNMPNELQFSSQYNTLKYFMEGRLNTSIVQSVDGFDTVTVTTSVNHNLGYFPFHVAYVSPGWAAANFHPQAYVSLGSGAAEYVTTFVTTTQLILSLSYTNNTPNPQNVSQEANCYYKIYKNNLGL